MCLLHAGVGPAARSEIMLDFPGSSWLEKWLVLKLLQLGRYFPLLVRTCLLRLGIIFLDLIHDDLHRLFDLRGS